MNIEVFEKENRTRVGIITVYSYASYSEQFNDAGSFTLSIPGILYTDILKKNNFILFDNENLGIIKYVGITMNKKDTLQVKGILLNGILSYRVISTQQNFSGTPENICEEIVDSNFVNPSDEKRKIPSFTVSSTEPASEEEVKKSVTGKDVLTAVSSLLETKEYGFEVRPTISTYDESSDNPTNISEMTFKVLHPADRSVNNSEGNDPVVFSLEMNNLKEMFYDMDATQECSTAIVAGENTGSSRTVVETGDIYAKGFDRIELYVDARDLQDVTETELKQRGDEKLEDNKEFTSFDCSLLNTAAERYKKDFFLGDYVTAMDKRLNISVKTQIKQVIHSSTGSDNVIDIIFGSEKTTLYELLKKGEI